eukprot:TRINITY_DN8635_c0_g1_i2.p1 TRINITY_DN8635_c0_g1~~TRINITY_DN8635_c0_g1_i2.p1  ORF type:complete len:647 (-),score=151.81 TRINITY_DN8635_c0_g1_i2:163-2103(-)
MCIRDRYQRRVRGENINMMQSTKEDMDEDILGSWAIVKDNKYAQVEELLHDLESQDTEPLTNEQEKVVCSNLTTLLIDQNITPLVLRCLKAFLKKMQDPQIIIQMSNELLDYLEDKNPTQRIVAIEAIKTLIVNVPNVDLLNSQSHEMKIVLNLLNTLLPRLIHGINKANVTDTLSIIILLLRQLGFIIRSFTKFRSINFYKDWFCTGLELGKGSYAKVYLGRHVRTAEVCALKVIDREILMKSSEKLKEQLNNEIEIMTQSSHPNIVKLYDVVREGPNLVLILEYCGGGDLDNFLKKKGGKLTEKETRYWLSQLSQGLRFLRDKDLIHRDLKPENLLLSTEADPNSEELPKLKITDFTFARFAEVGNLLTTVVGTPLYMAPEIFLERKYSVKGDLWSVGVILYQMMTGTLPFKGENVYELIAQFQKVEMAWPANIAISDDLKDLISNLLKKNPEFRMSWAEFFLHPCVCGETVSKSQVTNGESEALRAELEKLKAKLQDAEQKCKQEENEKQQLAKRFEDFENQVKKINEAHSEELEKNKWEILTLQKKLFDSEQNADTYALLLIKEQGRSDEQRKELESYKKKLEESRTVLAARRKTLDRAVSDLTIGTSFPPIFSSGSSSSSGKPLALEESGSIADGESGDAL